MDDKQCLNHCLIVLWFWLCRAMFTIGDSCAGRGEDVRHLTLPDMFPLPYKKNNRVGPCDFMPLYFVRNAGKTVSKAERVQFQAMARACNWLVCQLAVFHCTFSCLRILGRKGHCLMSEMEKQLGELSLKMIKEIIVVENILMQRMTTLYFFGVGVVVLQMLFSIRNFN